MRIVLKVRKKGILILPKSLREKSGIKEGDEVIVEAKENVITIRSLKPKVVDIEPELIEKLLSEEYRLERKKYGGILRSKETSS